MRRFVRLSLDRFLKRTSPSSNSPIVVKTAVAPVYDDPYYNTVPTQLKHPKSTSVGAVKSSYTFKQRTRLGKLVKTPPQPSNPCLSRPIRKEDIRHLPWTDVQEHGLVDRVTKSNWHDVPVISHPRIPRDVPQDVTADGNFYLDDDGIWDSVSPFKPTRPGSALSRDQLHMSRRTTGVQRSASDPNARTGARHPLKGSERGHFYNSPVDQLPDWPQWGPKPHSYAIAVSPYITMPMPPSTVPRPIRPPLPHHTQGPGPSSQLLSVAVNPTAAPPRFTPLPLDTNSSSDPSAPSPTSTLSSMSVFLSQFPLPPTSIPSNLEKDDLPHFRYALPVKHTVKEVVNKYRQSVHVKVDMIPSPIKVASRDKALQDHTPKDSCHVPARTTGGDTWHEIICAQGQRARLVRARFLKSRH
ncbi:hypothetical protein EW146_g5374 [Bondarzewia mesenterica]|uniref:Uncharacterized protein n=1 Tax=Bondarzewia mesenterica TaxID=1095465 RepID=A0A4S4LXG6_9AGAM|nr:hypothetical protein EW146_g5374 [Bondarzewia mesenterica]